MIFVLTLAAVLSPAVAGLGYLSGKRELTEEEFEREAKGRPSLMRAGLEEFHGFLGAGEKGRVRKE